MTDPVDVTEYASAANTRARASTPDERVAELRRLLDPEVGYEDLVVRHRLLNGEDQVIDTADPDDNLGVMAVTPSDDGGYTAQLIAASMNAAPVLLAEVARLSADNAALVGKVAAAEALADEIVALNHGALRPSWVVDRLRALGDTSVLDNIKGDVWDEAIAAADDECEWVNERPRNPYRREDGDTT